VSDAVVLPDLDIALFGYGRWGERLGRAIEASPWARLAAVVEPDPVRAAEARRAHPGSTVVAGIDDLGGDQPAAAVVATPAATHARMALDLLGRGIHVMVEKPLALTPSDARSVAASASDAGLVVTVGHTFLFSAAFARFRERIEAGAIGRLERVVSERLAPGTARPDCDALWNLAPHDVSLLLAVAGQVPVSVDATRRYQAPHALAVEYRGSVEFGSGLTGEFHVSCAHPTRVRRLSAIGTDGRLSLSFTPELSLHGEIGGRPIRPEVLSEPEPLVAEIAYFAQRCLARVIDVSGPDMGIAVVDVLAAAERSAEFAAPVVVAAPASVGAQR
jgi:predicted dehydrogenase